MDARLALLQARKSNVKKRLLVKADWQEEFVLRMQLIDLNHAIYMHSRSNNQFSKEGTLQHTQQAAPKLFQGNAPNAV
jgi:hypothetical protein